MEQDRWLNENSPDSMSHIHGMSADSSMLLIKVALYV